MIKSQYNTVFLLILCFISVASAQVANDECLISEYIPDISGFCSGETAFSNVGATASADPVPDCWTAGDEEADVWYSFRPREAGVLLRLIGRSSNSDATLDNAAITLYQGNCGNLTEVICSDVDENQQDIIERVSTDLIIGSSYYLRVSSAAATAGTFELCIRQFTPVPVPESDCGQGVVLCDKSSFFIENLNSVGRETNELPSDGCITEEMASAWYIWTIENTGDLTFTLTPTGPDPREDLDFILFRLPDGVRNCNNKEVVRCMASGESAGLPSTACFGPTGLREGSTDIVEAPGCENGSDNFLAPVAAVAGETYALIVNNFSESGFGFTLDFGGSATFLGPQPDFEIIADDGFECDRVIRFSNESVSATDMIVDYEWNFGDAASPQNASGAGPHDVIYETFGEKLAALTVTTNRGCSVTEIKDISIDTCCVSNSLTVQADIIASNCNGGSEAVVSLMAGSGNPLYIYSFESGPFLVNNVFGGLSEGMYDYEVIDSKGCRVSNTVSIVDPEPITLAISSALDRVALGSGTTLMSMVGPNDRTYTYTWTPSAGLSCTDCPDPSVIPPGETTYTLTVTDEVGCTESMSLTIFTDNNKAVIAPNAMSLAAANIGNRRFKISGNIAVQNVQFIKIYDRWGNVLYSEENVNLSDPNYIGWDGTVNGKEVNPGVYVWAAEIRYIDQEVETLSGDITIFK